MALLSLRELCEQQESEYLQLQRMDAYVNGTQDQYRDDADCVRENLRNCYYVPKHVSDNEENRNEFNRRFNRIISDHATCWKDWSIQDRNRAFFAYKYMRLFQDLMVLLEKFPDAGSREDYYAVVHNYFHYCEEYEYCMGKTPHQYADSHGWAVFSKESDYRWEHCTRLNKKRDAFPPFVIDNMFSFHESRLPWEQMFVIADYTGIPINTLDAYQRKNVLPTMQDYNKLADYFHWQLWEADLASGEISFNKPD